MACFFSGTDTDTLRSEGSQCNNFVSLIVNNEGTYCAAITRQLNIKKVIKESYNYKFFAEEAKKGANTYNAEEVVIEYFDLSIEKQVNFDFGDLDGRISEIKKKNTPKISNVKTYDLFDTLPDKKYTQTELPFDASYKQSKYKFDSKIIDSIVLQLISCSIIVPDNSNINVSKWVNSMDTLLTKRFKCNFDDPKNIGFLTFIEWAEATVDMLLNEAANEYRNDKQFGYILSDIAEKVIDKFETFKTNKFINEYINILSNYLL